MMKYAKVLLASITLFGACTNKKEVPTPTVSVTTAPAIVEARKWFEQNVAPQAAKQPIWNKATVTMRDGKPEVYVPIKYISARQEANGERRRLLIAFNEQGVRQASLYRLVAEAYYAKASKNQVRTDDFTGLALNFNWENDNFISGSKYVEGKRVGDVFKRVVKNSAQKPSNDCSIVTVTYYSYSCSGGSCTDPVVVGVQTYTFCSGGTSSGGGDGSGGIGGSGSGGGGGGGSGGGGSGDSGCGDGLVCPDGSENPNTPRDEVAITEVLNEPVQDGGNARKVLRIKFNTYQTLEVRVEVNTANHTMTSANVILSGVTPYATLTQVGNGILTGYSNNIYYFNIGYYISYGSNSANNGIKEVNGWFNLDDGTGILIFPR